MNYQQRKKKVCEECAKRIGCAYLCRGLEDKCEHLEDIMTGWELGQQDMYNDMYLSLG